MDVCLTQLVGAMDVDVMAGATDPANHALPQQALHPCLLPGAVTFPTLHRQALLNETTPIHEWSRQPASFNEFSSLQFTILQVGLRASRTVG
jgi:hypothetical protein